MLPAVSIQRLSTSHRRIALIILVVGAFCGSAGCRNWSGFAGNQQQQYQVETERLLSEFRTQKQRAESLKSENEKLAERLAESEKLVAKMQNGRSSSLASTPLRSYPTDPQSLTRGTPAQSVSTGSHLLQSTPPTGGIQWRPVRPVD